MLLMAVFLCVKVGDLTWCVKKMACAKMIFSKEGLRIAHFDPTLYITIIGNYFV